MSTQVVVAVVSAVVAVVGAVAAGLMTTWSAQRTRRYESLLEAQQKALSKAEQAEAVLGRYREPLLAAAHNLQSRLYNIVDQSYLAVYLRCGDPDQERYARDYTVYVLAEYLCWAEIIRRDMRFLDLGSEEGNRELMRKLNATHGAIGNERSPRALRLFRGEQRAIGELMMTPTGDPTGDRGSARYESLGFVQFCAQLDDDPVFAKWFHRLRGDIDQVAAATRSQRSRLIDLQNRLIDLIEFLDPDCWRPPPANRRKRLALPSKQGIEADADGTASGR
ncbi:MAG: hypothetical protein ACRD1G_13190 [Acidimicrobiales bacterium]